MNNGSHLGHRQASPHPGNIVEMRDFDRLPASLRAELAQAPIIVSSASITAAVKSMGEGAALAAMRLQLLQGMPKMIAVAWGPDHPEIKTYRNAAAREKRRQKKARDAELTAWADRKFGKGKWCLA